MIIASLFCICTKTLCYTVQPGNIFFSLLRAFIDIEGTLTLGLGTAFCSFKFFLLLLDRARKKFMQLFDICLTSYDLGGLFSDI